MTRLRYFTPHPLASPTQVRVFEVFFGKTSGDRTRQIIDLGITSLILASVVAIVLESMPALHERYALEFYVFEVFSIAIFSLEYLLRLWSVPAGKADLKPVQARIGYLTSFHGLIDLCAILPFYLQFLFPGLDLRFLRAMRMLRFLKLSHYSTALEDLFRAIRDEHESFVSALYILGIAILMTSCLAYYAEHQAQPEKFGSIPDAMWWSIITLTTVGYGDVSPITPFGKFVGVATALMGVCTVALLTGIVASSFANQMARKRALFEAELIKALQDGRISEEEEASLELLRQSFNLTREHANAIVKRVKQEHGPG